MFYIVMFNITIVSIKAHGHMCVIYLNFVFWVQCIAHMLLGDAYKKKSIQRKMERHSYL